MGKKIVSTSTEPVKGPSKSTTWNDFSMVHEWMAVEVTNKTAVNSLLAVTKRACTALARLYLKALNRIHKPLWAVGWLAGKTPLRHSSPSGKEVGNSG
jgi:hypothetical protein